MGSPEPSASGIHQPEHHITASRPTQECRLNDMIILNVRYKNIFAWINMILEMYKVLDFTRGGFYKIVGLDVLKNFRLNLSN